MNEQKPKILVLATESCAYPGADYVGQIHASYPSNTYILRVPAPVIFPEAFYLRCFEKGIAGIIVMACGHECPYEGAYDRLARRVAVVRTRMRELGMDPQRLRLCSICTVCARPFLKEIHEMDAFLSQATTGSVTT
ncbi:MAG: hydrogenase iron-sulfur subunit [Deltaproteobacteria bacterium]|nr:hydrogenase iron-sulfur subunit [Deltaproteobacteria bacterium]